MARTLAILPHGPGAPGGPTVMELAERLDRAAGALVRTRIENYSRQDPQHVLTATSSNAVVHHPRSRRRDAVAHRQVRTLRADRLRSLGVRVSERTDRLVGTATAPLDSAAAAALFQHLVEHMEEGDAALERLAAEHVRMSFGDSSIAMQRVGDGLRFRIEANDERTLQMWREGAVEHVAEEQPAAAAAMRWSDAGVRVGTLPANFRPASVVASDEVLPGLLRVQLRLDEPLGPGGIHVRLLVPPSGRAPMWPLLGPNGAPRWPVGEETLHARAYTIRRADDGGRCLTFDIVRHVGGRVAQWAEAVRSGDAVGLMGPSGGEEAPATDGDLLIAGDMTALPAMARMLEVLPADVRVRAWVACPSQADADAYLGAGGANTANRRVTAVDPQRFDATIVDSLRAQPAPDAAWFAGELATAKALRRLFRDDWALGPRRRLAASYWERTG